tara:strand:- start:24 stop:251 length:228 start_codon:yes stop_codon:yes gene_type:complete
MTEIKENTIVEEIMKARAEYFHKYEEMPEVLIIDPYVGAEIRDHLGMSDLDELKRFEGMEVAYSLDKNGEPYRLL